MIRMLRLPVKPCASLWQIRSIHSKKKFDINDLNDILKSSSSASNLEQLKQNASNTPQRTQNRAEKKVFNKPQKMPFKNTNNQQQKKIRFNPKSGNRDPFHAFDPATFKWTESQSTLENEYITAKIKEVHAVNPQFSVIHYTDDGLKQEKLRRFIQNLKAEESFDIVNVQQIDNVEYPFVRIVNKQAALKNYNEKLAQEKSKLFGRTREKRRESGIKYLKVSWSISFTDLENQKTNEIVGLLKKGQKVVVIIDSKNNLNKHLNELLELHKAENTEKQLKLQTETQNEVNELELLKREKILAHMKNIQHEKMVIQGDVKTGLIITISPQSNASLTAEEKKLQKNDKKLERQLKQKQREEQKRLAAEAKAKLFNETVSKL